MANTLRVIIMLVVVVPLISISTGGIFLYACPLNPNNGRNNKPQENSVSKLQSEAFSQYFTPFDTLNLNYLGLAIGDISRMLVLGNGERVVIEDAITNDVYWVNVKQKKHNKLSVEHMIPGHKLLAISMSKGPEESFWITRVPNFVFKFNGEGQLVKFWKIPHDNLSRKSLVDDKSGIIAVTDHLESNYVLRFSTVNDDLDTLFTIKNNPQLKKIIQRFEGGGFLADENNCLYFANTLEDEISKYDLKGKVLSVFDGNNKRFKTIEQDVPEDKDGVLAFSAGSQSLVLSLVCIS